MRTHPAHDDRGLFERFVRERGAADRTALTERYLPLARSLAARYGGRGEAFEDIFQVACIGLVKAVDRYDPARGPAFSSYAVPTILGEIRRYFRDRTWSVHVPRDLQELALAVQARRTELEGRLERAPTIPEIAKALERSDEEVLEALQASWAQRAGSLDAPRGDGDDDESSVGATIGVDDDGFEGAERRELLGRLMVVLDERERRVVDLRFCHDLTQQEIGERIGVSQMQVSRILRQALAKLRDCSRERGRVAQAA
jgi:RNA polymerase sigma-B factor